MSVRGLGLRQEQGAQALLGIAESMKAYTTGWVWSLGCAAGRLEDATCSMSRTDA